MRRYLVALTLLSLPVMAASAQTPQQPADLNAYRVRAMLPSVCRQLGGKVVYGAQTSRCDLPKVLKGANAPTPPTTIPRPPLVTTQK